MTDRTDRTLDLILGGVLLLAANPVMLTCAVGVLLLSGPPIIYRQARVGRRGARFDILKFRTMIPNAEQMPWPPKTSDGALSERRLRRDDPRITLPGRILRRWALDELPQLFNVVRGDMSLVGPRPLPLEEWNRQMEQPGLQAIAGARPGMTGPYQVAIRQGSTFEEARRRELLHFRGHSVSQYLGLLLATPLALVRGGGDLLQLPPESPAIEVSRIVGVPGRNNEPASAIEALREAHSFQVCGRTLLFDPVTVRAFSIDETAAGVLQRIRDGSSRPLPGGLMGSQRQAWDELVMLGQWLANAHARLRRPPLGTAREGECRLMLDVTRACTLRCAYCYRADRTRDGSPTEHMSWQVAAVAVELLARLAKRWDCPGFLNFTGGEPLLRFDFLKRLVEHTAAVAQREDVDLKCSFGIDRKSVV
jgi:lipopolysaccharide/colanic/teichoic acid biosynthesis glycosyltransferase